MDNTATNYNKTATQDDGSCTYTPTCSDNTYAFNINQCTKQTDPTSTCSDGYNLSDDGTQCLCPESDDGSGDAQCTPTSPTLTCPDTYTLNGDNKCDAPAETPQCNAGYILNDGDTLCVASKTVSITGISVKTPPTKIIYTAGDVLDLTGLVVTLSKSDESTQDVAFADFGDNGITASPVNGAVLATTDSQVVISDNSKTADQLITVNSLANNIGTRGGTTNYETITASFGANGSISPNGSISVAYGNNQTFLITPAAGYQVVDVSVDDVSKGAITTYTFDDVVADHIISATFSAVASGSSGSSSSSGFTGTTSANTSTSNGSTTKIGDINGDGSVDEADFSILMSEWGQTGTGLSADLNHDGVVDESDFSILMANWGL